METIKYLKYSLLLTIGILFSGCGTEYINYNDTLIKKVQWDTVKEYQKFEKNNKDIVLDGYKVELYRVEPYFKLTGNYLEKSILMQSRLSLWESYSRSYWEYFYDYTFLMFTLNKNPYKKEFQPYFNDINSSYENKLNQTNINQFVNYPCDKNIVFSERERDEDLKPLLVKCYAKRLDDETFLITRFAHPNTQKDTELFSNEIIPKMLESIKLTPTKISPWKYY